ncbi:MAG: DUF4271 domain-containing protein [Luteibaculaceae bacterium]
MILLQYAQPLFRVKETNESIVFAIVTGILILFATVKYFSPKTFFLPLQIISKPLFKNFEPEENTFKLRVEEIGLLLATSFLIAINFSLNFTENSFFLWSEPIVAIYLGFLPLLILLTHITTINLLSFLLPKDYGLTAVAVNSYYFFLALGYLFLPLSLLYLVSTSLTETLGNYFFWITIIVVSLLRLYRSFRSTKNSGAHLFGILLYLCALEIAPVLILLKLVGLL